MEKGKGNVEKCRCYHTPAYFTGSENAYRQSTDCKLNMTTALNKGGIFIPKINWRKENKNESIYLTAYERQNRHGNH